MAKTKDWQKAHDKQQRRIDKDIRKLNSVLKKYEPDFSKIIKDFYDNYSDNGMIDLDGMAKSLTYKEQYKARRFANSLLHSGEYKEDRYLTAMLSRIANGTKLNREQWLEIQFREVLSRLKREQKGIITDSLYRTYLDTQRTTARLLDLMYKPHGDDLIYDLINTKWHGKTITQRLYEQAAKVLESWMKRISEWIADQKALNDVLKRVKEWFDKPDGRAKVLLGIESTRINSEAKIDSFKRNNIEYYQFLAVMDSVTTKVCRYHDLKIYKVSEAKLGVNLPPLEPIHFCRSTIKTYTIDESIYNQNKSIKGGVSVGMETPR